MNSLNRQSKSLKKFKGEKENAVLDLRGVTQFKEDQSDVELAVSD